VYALEAGGWALGLGTSVEHRTRYTPIEASIAGVNSPTELTPGTVIRGSVALDRVVGQGRLSFLLTGDWFGESSIAIPSQNGATSRYKLGPQFSANMIWETGARGFRFLTVTLADRYRSKFKGFDGATADNSNGNVFEAALEGIRGGATGTGVYVRLDGKLDSGLDVDDTITTAAMTAVGVSLGLAMPMGRASILPFIRGQVGSLDAGPVSTRATGFGAGISLTVR
jgi:hypothetical protein